MLISRRSFVSLISIVPATSRASLSHLLAGPGEEIEVTPELALSPCKGRFVTSARTITGPARLYAFEVPPLDGDDRSKAGRLSLRRSGDAMLVATWGFMAAGGYRWISCPTGEIVISAGQSLLVDLAARFDCFLFYERPGPDGTYPVFTPFTGERDWEAFDRECDAESDELDYLDGLI